MYMCSWTAIIQLWTIRGSGMLTMTTAPHLLVGCLVGPLTSVAPPPTAATVVMVY